MPYLYTGIFFHLRIKGTAWRIQGAWDRKMEEGTRIKYYEVAYITMLPGLTDAHVESLTDDF